MRRFCYDCDTRYATVTYYHPAIGERELCSGCASDREEKDRLEAEASRGRRFGYG